MVEFTRESSSLAHLARDMQNAVRPRSMRRPEAIVVAASTGGPQALATLFSELGKMISSVPVYVVLHMPEHFTDVVTAQIERMSGCVTRAPKDGEVAKCGHIYFAPGSRHLALVQAGPSVSMRLDAGPAINFCRPSADKLFSSAAEVYGRSLIGIVLSGMGSDGCIGAAKIVETGGVVVAQDKETSAVWGMPAAVVEAGLASHVLPIDWIAGHVGRLLKGESAGVAA